MNTNLHDQSDPYASKKASSDTTLTSSDKLDSYSSLSVDDHHLYIETNKFKCPLHDRNRTKFINRPRSQPNRCICTSERYYNCNYCTSNYPISVRRSKDGEESDYPSTLNKGFENTTESRSAKIQLRPSPLPVSSHLIALLSLTTPSNKFIPPPNKNLTTLNKTRQDRDTELLVCK